MARYTCAPPSGPESSNAYVPAGERSRFDLAFDLELDLDLRGDASSLSVSECVESSWLRRFFDFPFFFGESSSELRVSSSDSSLSRGLLPFLLRLCLSPSSECVSLLLSRFERFFGFDFLGASAAAKIVNVACNFSALLWFGYSGHLLWQLGLMMAACQIAGSLIGTRLALKHGSGFVRKLFLVVVTGLILKTAYDAFTKIAGMGHLATQFPIVLPVRLYV